MGLTHILLLYDDIIIMFTCNSQERVLCLQVWYQIVKVNNIIRTCFMMPCLKMSTTIAL